MLEALVCARCSSTKLERTSFGTYRCSHCGTAHTLSVADGLLKIAAWVCEKCGFDNESWVEYCSNCGNSLLADCPFCDRRIRANSLYCNKCGANLGYQLPPIAWVENGMKTILTKPRYGKATLPIFGTTAYEKDLELTPLALVVAGAMGQGSFADLWQMTLAQFDGLKVGFLGRKEKVRTDSCQGVIVFYCPDAVVRVLIQPGEGSERGVLFAFLSSSVEEHPGSLDPSSYSVYLRGHLEKFAKRFLARLPWLTGVRWEAKPAVRA